MNQTIHQNGLSITLQRLEPPFNEFVNFLYEVKGKLPLGNQRVFPREGVEILFNLADPITTRSSVNDLNGKLETGLIIGNRSGFFDFQTKQPLHLCGIRFTLNGFFRLTGIGQNDFKDSFYPYDSIFNTHSFILNEKILSQKSLNDRFSILKTWIAELFRQRKDFGHFITSYLIREIQTNQLKLLSELEKTSGYSRKHLFQSFKNETGLSLKSYQRISRFNMLLHKIKESSNWLDMAFDIGLYDQSHLIKEVRHYTGLSPKQLRKSPFDPIGKVLPIKSSLR